MTTLRLRGPGLGYDLVPARGSRPTAAPVRVLGREGARRRLQAIVRAPGGAEETLDRLAAWLAVGALELRPRPRMLGRRAEVDEVVAIVDLADLAG